MKCAGVGARLLAAEMYTGLRLRFVWTSRHRWGWYRFVVGTGPATVYDPRLFPSRAKAVEFAETQGLRVDAYGVCYLKLGDLQP